MDALPIDTAGLVGAVWSAVVGANGTDAAANLGVPLLSPLSLRPFPVHTDPLVPIHWFDASVGDSMYRESFHITDVGRVDRVKLWT